MASANIASYQDSGRRVVGGVHNGSQVEVHIGRSQAAVPGSPHPTLHQRCPSTMNAALTRGCAYRIDWHAAKRGEEGASGQGYLQHLEVCDPYLRL